MTHRTQHDSETVSKVLDKVYDGTQIAEISRELGVPVRSIHRWVAKYEAPGNDARRAKQRVAFLAVMETVNEIRGTIGNSAAMDYSKVTGGQGAQFHPSDVGHRLIDYTVDAQAAAESVLTSSELEFFNTALKGQEIDLTNQSSSFMRLQEKLGRVFIARGLFPVTNYFKTGKGNT